MKSLVLVGSRESILKPQPGIDEVASYGQLAQGHYRFHIGRTKLYLRGFALLMVVSLACSAWLTFGGPKVLLIPAMAIPLALIALRVDRKLSFHLRAAAEYLRSMTDFEELTESAWLPKAIKSFEIRCQIYGPSKPV